LVSLTYFTFRGEWRYIPENEIFSVWTEFDLAMAAPRFKKKHESDGSLIAFWTTDLIEWEILGTITEREVLIHEDVV
jgi:hypothetical protein